MTTKAKPKKTPTQAPKKGGYIMVGENTKTGRKSVGGLTKNEALRAAEDFRKDVHTIDTSILKERTSRKSKTKPRAATKPETKPGEPVAAAP